MLEMSELEEPVCSSSSSSSSSEDISILDIYEELLMLFPVMLYREPQHRVHNFVDEVVKNYSEEKIGIDNQEGTQGMEQNKTQKQKKKQGVDDLTDQALNALVLARKLIDDPPKEETTTREAEFCRYLLSELSKIKSEDIFSDLKLDILHLVAKAIKADNLLISKANEFRPISRFPNQLVTNSRTPSITETSQNSFSPPIISQIPCRFQYRSSPLYSPTTSNFNETSTEYSPSPPINTEPKQHFLYCPTMNSFSEGLTTYSSSTPIPPTTQTQNINIPYSSTYKSERKRSIEIIENKIIKNPTNTSNIPIQDASTTKDVLQLALDDVFEDFIVEDDDIIIEDYDVNKYSTK